MWIQSAINVPVDVGNGSAALRNSNNTALLLLSPTYSSLFILSISFEFVFRVIGI
jgi:hypothetical protein